jgi:hypothetical protein
MLSELLPAAEAALVEALRAGEGDSCRRIFDSILGV